MPDFLTLKLAIYFIAPAAVLYVAAYLCAGVLTLTAQIFVEHDVSHDTATSTMAIVIAATAGVAALVYWTTQVLWATLIAGSAASFLIGALLYSRVFKDLTPRDTGSLIAKINLRRGFSISAIITISGLAITFLILRAGGLSP